MSVEGDQAPGDRGPPSVALILDMGHRSEPLSATHTDRHPVERLLDVEGELLGRPHGSQ